MSKIERRTQIPAEPRKGSGHPNIDPALKDPIPVVPKKEPNKI